MRKEDYKLCIICGDFATLAPIFSDSHNIIYCDECFSVDCKIRSERESRDFRHMKRCLIALGYLPESRSAINEKSLTIDSSLKPNYGLFEMALDMYSREMYEEGKILLGIVSTFYEKNEKLKPERWWKKLFK